MRARSTDSAFKYVLTRRVAALDPSLQAVLVARTPLHYVSGDDPESDRPSHVRAASSLAWIMGHIAVIQDDANFVAVVDPASMSVRAIALPRGPGGLRLFDDLRGNKNDKLDLEACVSIDGAEGPILLAFGSGSKSARRRIAVIDHWHETTARVSIVHAAGFYEELDGATDFAGSDMNIEGASATAHHLRLFGRGNGIARHDLLPVNATCDVALDALLAYLDDPVHVVAPRPQGIVQYDLGSIDGIPLGFTDATQIGDSTLYSAAAEHSPDATTDGPVAGSALGVIAPDGRTRYALLTDTRGNPLRDKVEGVLPSRSATNRAFIVIDADDPQCPSELCEVELSGPWQTRP